MRSLLRTTALLAAALLLSGFLTTTARGQGTCNVQAAHISSISNPVVTEGDSGTTTVSFDVHCNPCGPVFSIVYWRINDLTATTADNDYVDTSGRFDAIGTSNAPEVHTATVTVNGDTNFEPDEMFEFELITGIVNGQASPSVGPPCFFLDVDTGVATILNDDDPNQPPVADAGPDDTVECASPAGTAVLLDGTGSSDPDGDPLTYTWTGPFSEGGGTTTGATPTVTLPFGVHVLTLTVDDGNGETDTDNVQITVADTVDPVITLTGGDLTLECPMPYNEPGATAVDACVGAVPVTISGTVMAGTPGIYPITYMADDGHGNTATATRTVTVEDTTPPEITLNGGDLTLECAVDTYNEPGATVTDGCDPSPSLVIDASSVDVSTPGTYTVTYTATDASSNTAVETRTVTVEDTIAPDITVAAGPIELWPPNHAYHTISLDAVVTGASDLCDLSVDAGDVGTASTSSDEEENATGTGDGNTLNDIVIAGDCRSVDVRAERQGGSNGRVYTLNLEVADASDNVGTASFGVHVPHSKKSGAVDDGPAYSVAGCAPLARMATAEAEAPGGEVTAASLAQATALAARPVAATAEETPATFVLEPNYPNPFNPQTSIRFGVPEAAVVSLVVYDALGREVERLVDGAVAAGMHTAVFEAGTLTSGLYVYRLTTPQGAFTQTMLLLK